VGNAATAAVAFFLLQALISRAIEPASGADAWHTNDVPLPSPFHDLVPATNQFESVKAEVIAEKLRVTWDAEPKLADAKVIASADAPGHWPARDWRTHAMHRSGGSWSVQIPVDSLDVPLIYFIVAQRNGRGIASPMRIATPRALGLEQPTRIFWPFVEGFEQGLEGWRTIGGPELQTGVPSKNGRTALAVRVPESRRSVTIVTTRLRGWFLEEHGATGVGLWLRTKRGNSTAAFTVFANAYSAEQVVARRAAPISIADQWTRVELPFRTFPKFPLGEVDLFSIELTAKPGTEFLLDDVHLLGRWGMDF